LEEAGDIFTHKGDESAHRKYEETIKNDHIGQWKIA